MRALELVLIVTVLILLYTSLSLRNIAPKLSLRNDYFLLKEEAYSVARVLADSRILTYLMQQEGAEDELKVIVTALTPANREFRVRIIDTSTGEEFVIETPQFKRSTLAATAIVVYSDSTNNRIYVIELSLGKITGG